MTKISERTVTFGGNLKTKRDVALYLRNCIARSGKTQLQIAEEAGFPTPNVVSMMKTGQLKIPLARVPAIAKSLGIDPLELFHLCLEAYEPELYECFSVVAPSVLITSRELQVIKSLREASRSGTFM